jgi:hypothetical protein
MAGERPMESNVIPSTLHNKAKSRNSFIGFFSEKLTDWQTGYPQMSART